MVHTGYVEVTIEVDSGCKVTDIPMFQYKKLIFLLNVTNNKNAVLYSFIEVDAT